jgi:3-oxoacyl-[acyl-carrier-protein] synthase-1
LDRADRTALIVGLPEAFRKHPALAAGGAGFLEGIQKYLGVRFHPASRPLQLGPAGTAHGLAVARELLGQGAVEDCIVGGVDSLINERDLARLRESFRLHGPNQAQGAIPGEGASFLRVTTDARSQPALARVVGIGLGMEPDTVLGERYSQGRGLLSALDEALRDAEVPEGEIAFRVSDVNGERYRFWESVLAECRFYRTRRESFPVWYLAASVGDLGAAAGALSIVASATAIARGYAPGAYAMCEASSDEGLRGACLIAPARGARHPPFKDSWESPHGIA